MECWKIRLSCEMYNVIQIKYLIVHLYLYNHLLSLGLNLELCVSYSNRYRKFDVTYSANRTTKKQKESNIYPLLKETKKSDYRKEVAQENWWSVKGLTINTASLPLSHFDGHCLY